MLVALLGLVAFSALGCLLIVVGVVRARDVLHLRRYDSRPVNDLNGTRGPVKIQGRAAGGTDGNVTAPFFGSSCLLYTYEVEERRGVGQHRDWETIDAGMGGVDFIVDGETGRATVNPTGADVALDGHSETVKPGGELPDRLADHIARTPDVDPQDRNPLRHITDLTGGNTQRFTERRLDVGDDVAVYGQAQRGYATEQKSRTVDATVGDGNDTPVFIISDTGTAGTALRIARGGIWRIAFGAVIILGAVVGVLVVQSL